MYIDNYPPDVNLYALGIEDDGMLDIFSTDSTYEPMTDEEAEEILRTCKL